MKNIKLMAVHAKILSLIYLIQENATLLESLTFMTLPAKSQLCFTTEKTECKKLTQEDFLVVLQANTIEASEKKIQAFL